MQDLCRTAGLKTGIEAMRHIGFIEGGLTYLVFIFNKIQIFTGEIPTARVFLHFPGNANALP